MLDMFQYIAVLSAVIHKGLAYLYLGASLGNCCEQHAGHVASKYTLHESFSTYLRTSEVVM